MIKKWKVDILTMQETKMQQIDHKMERDLWGRRPFKYIHKQAEGRSGGILVAWNTNSVEMIDSRIGEFSVGVLFRDKAENREVTFAGVYGPSDPVGSERLWGELSGIMAIWNVLWCIGGDFSVVCFSSERIGASRITSQMSSFNGFIDDHGLVYLSLKGVEFTWINNHIRRAYSHLDRFLVSHELVSLISIISQEVLPNSASNHILILLRA